MTVMLLEWVITSVFLILVVLALRAALGRRMSAGLRYALWAVVLARLLVPVQLFTTPIAGVWTVTETRTEQVVTNHPATPMRPANPSEDDIMLSLGGQAGPSAVLSNVPQAPAAPSLPEPPDLSDPPGWLVNLGRVWLAGAALAAFVLLLSNLRFYGQLRRVRVPLEVPDCPLRVYMAEGLPSPCLFGIIRPAVYVTPEGLDPVMLRHMLAHECTHFRHGDHIWSLLRCAALAVHWWNPLVWLSAVLSRRDAELACDEGALKRLGDGERAKYGTTLLALVTAKPRPGDLFRCATTMAGDKKSLKERVSRIARSPKRVLWVAAVAVLVTALACVCAFGQAAEPEDEPDPLPSASQRAEPEDNGRYGGNTGDIPAQVRADAEQFVRGRFESLRDKRISYGIDGTAVYVADEIDLPELDDWRIERLTGPYWSGEAYWEMLGIDRRVELWNVVYAYHSTTPDKAWNMVAGATELTEDGWLTPINYGAEYLVYELGEDGSRTLLTTFGEQGEVLSVGFRRNLRVELAIGGVPEDMQDAYVVKEHAELPLSDLGREVDLNRNGVPEFAQVVEFGGGAGQRLELWEGDRLIWAEAGYYAHAGYNALFLCTLDGQDYLLRYNPYMGQGWCEYSYQLFTLENGVETASRENHIEFDVNFGLMHVSFDPEAIAAFMDEINGLLAHSVQLINTDEGLLSIFREEGRLYDSHWWLDGWAPVFTRDENASLLENLRAYKAAMEAEWYAGEPELTNLSETSENARVWLRYKDKDTKFDVDYWDFTYQPAEQVDIQVLDLNGDGKDELVFPLVWGHGTGTYIEKLYVFDAETLEQYDTSGLNDMILGSVVSTGDEDNFYLDIPAPPGRSRVTVPRSAAQKKSPDAPMADKLGLGDIIRYTIQDGQVFCWLECDASGVTLNYIGYIDIPVKLDRSGNFSCGSAQYTALAYGRFE